MAERKHWEPQVVDGQVVIDRELTTEERLDRLERIANDVTIDLTAHGGGNIRRHAAILHLIMQRGWFRRG